MRKQFSFKDDAYLQTNQDSYERYPSNSYYIPRRGVYQHDRKHSQNSSWTDLRVEEIKRKYDTPSSRNRISSGGSFYKHQRVKTDINISSRSKSKYQYYQRFASLRRQTQPQPMLLEMGSVEPSEDHPTGLCQRVNYQNDSLRLRDGGKQLGGSNIASSRQMNINAKNNRMRSEQASKLLRGEERDGVQGNINRNSVDNKENYLEGDEVVVFKRIQQMKQSLLQQKHRSPYVDTYCNKETQQSSVQRQHFKQSHLKEYTNNGLIDPRIKNIDKINSKIRQILQCLHQNENQGPRVSKQQMNRSREFKPIEKYILFKDSVSKEISCKDSVNLKSSNFQQTQILERQKITYIADQRLNQTENYHRQQYKHKQLIEKDTYARDQNSMFDLDQQSLSILNEKKWIEEFQRQKIEQNLRRSKYSIIKSRSRSSLATAFIKKLKESVVVDNHSNCKKSRNDQATDQQIKLSAGKKVNQQIERIQQRIKYFQQEKKRLHIKFTPFQYQKQRKSYLNFAKPPLPSYRHPDQRNNQNKPLQKNSNKAKVSEFNCEFDDIAQKYNRKDKEGSAEECLKEEKTQNQNQSERYNKYKQNNQVSSQSKNREAMKQIEQVPYDNQQLRIKAGEGIEDRKRRLATKETDIKSQQTKRLVSELCRQAQLDEQFRNGKMWLDSSCNVSCIQKWGQIKSILSNQSILMSTNEVQELFGMTEDENNPFYSCRQSGSSFEAVVKAYVEARKNWEKMLLNGFQTDKLIKQNIRQGKIDLQRKGYLVLEDLVRLLNIESGKFYRNRDIVLIWRRLAGTKNQMEFEEFFQQISKSKAQ